MEFYAIIASFTMQFALFQSTQKLHKIAFSSTCMRSCESSLKWNIFMLFSSLALEENKTDWKILSYTFSSWKIPSTSIFLEFLFDWIISHQGWIDWKMIDDSKVCFEVSIYLLEKSSTTFSKWTFSSIKYKMQRMIFHWLRSWIFSWWVHEMQ